MTTAVPATGVERFPSLASTRPGGLGTRPDDVALFFPQTSEPGLKSSDPIGRAGSSPALGTIIPPTYAKSHSIGSLTSRPLVKSNSLQHRQLSLA